MVTAEYTDLQELQVLESRCSCGPYQRKKKPETIEGMNAVTRHACMFAAPLDTALVLMDADGRIWAANRSACLLLGWHRGELWHTPIRGMDLRVRADFEIGRAHV